VEGTGGADFSLSWDAGEARSGDATRFWRGNTLGVIECFRYFKCLWEVKQIDTPTVQETG